MKATTMPTSCRKITQEEDEREQLRVDPSLILGSDLMAHIFSFVGGGSGSARHRANIAPTIVQRPGEGTVRLLALQEAGRLHRFLTSICKRWREICQERLSFILGPLNGTFNTLGNSDKVQACMDWMGMNKLRIGALYLWNIDLEDVTALIILLQECETTGLEKIAANLCLRNTSCTFEAQKDLHDTIAQECPNLQELFTCLYYITAPHNQSHRFSHSLFSLPSIHRLHINLCHLNYHLPWGGAMGDCNVLKQVTANLKCLQELRVGGGFAPVENYGCMIIEHDTLRTLDVSDLSDNMYVRCHCPRLETFSCKGSNGSVPDISSVTRFRALRSLNPPSHDGSVTFSAETTPFVGVFVPPTCQCTVTHFREYDRNRFALFVRRLGQVKRAILQVQD